MGSKHLACTRLEVHRTNYVWWHFNCDLKRCCFSFEGKIACLTGKVGWGGGCLVVVVWRTSKKEKALKQEKEDTTLGPNAASP